MELIETSGLDSVENSNNPTVQHLIDFSKITNTMKHKQGLLVDKCNIAIYILDNSCSMEEPDGKIFQLNTDGTVTKIPSVSRWSELASKIIKIANYNVTRGMSAAYYLLNPLKTQKWVENTDFVFIQDTDIPTKLDTLSGLLLPTNIRGNTPLDIITDFFVQSLQQYIQMETVNDAEVTVCFNILTDGQPNNKQLFEAKLRKLINKYNLFITINMCTDNEDIVGYYNNLDRTLGNELSGFDVIDDLESEQIEVIGAGNTFFVYSHDIHVARMAGCYSKIADLLDEEPLSNHYLTRLCKELCGNFNSTPHWSNREVYLKFLSDHNIQVYDCYYGYMRPLFDISKINWRLWQQEQLHHISKWYPNSANCTNTTLYIVGGTLLFLGVALINSA
tara:strand:+ start:210 stop:1379 length:1170 start_codon:yes stop_codon:yes gene_type:complete